MTNSIKTKLKVEKEAVIYVIKKSIQDYKS